VRQRGLLLRRRPAARGLAEERRLAELALLLLEQRLADGAVERRHVLRAVPAEPSSAPAWTSASNTRLLHARRSTRSTKSKKSLYGPVLGARGEHRVDRALADVAHRAEAEADALVADDGELVAALVDVGGEDLDPHLARLGHVLHHRVGVADAARQERGHEVGRVVRLEVRRVVRHHRVGDRVRLVEAVAPERLDLAGDVLDDRALVPLVDRLRDELAELLLDELRVLLAHRLAQHVGLGERDAGERLRDAHHLLLVGDHALRLAQDGLELGELVADRLLAALAPDVDLVHPGVERAGAQQRVRRHEVVEAVAAHLPEHVGGERRLELEDAGRAPRAQHAVRLGLVEAERVEVEPRAGARLDRLERVVDDRERREAEEVHLQHARLLEAVHVVLRDGDLLVAVAAARALAGLRAHGDELVHRPRRDHHAGGVHAGVARQPLERDGVVEQLAVARLVLVQPADVGHLLDGLGHRQREVGRVGDELRQRVGLRRREAEDAAHVLDHGARLHRPERHDLADRLLAVLLPDVLDDLAAPLEAEVHVHVGHGHALRVQEALEQEVELEGQTFVMPSA
jgi:hypothetical protein